MPNTWISNYITNITSESYTSPKLRESVLQYFQARSAGFKLLQSCLMSVTTDINEAITNHLLDDSDLSEDDVIAIIISAVSEFNADNNTFFDAYSTALYTSEGLMFSMINYGLAFWSDTLETTPILNNLKRFEFVETSNIDSDIEYVTLTNLQDNDPRPPQYDPQDYDYDTIHCSLWADGFTASFYKISPLLDTEKIGMLKSVYPKDVFMHIDQFMLDQVNQHQKTLILEGAISLSDNIEINYSDLTNFSSTHFGEPTTDSVNFLDSVYATFRSSGSSILAKLNALVTPVVNSLLNVVGDDSVGITLTNVSYGEYTGSSPLASWFTNVNITLVQPISLPNVLNGIKALGAGIATAFSWVGSKFNSFRRYVDDNIINAKDFSVIGKDCADRYFAFPILQGEIVHNTNFTNIGNMFTPGAFPYDDSATYFGRLFSQGKFVELITDFGSVLFSYNNGTLTYQIFLIPSKPLNFDNNTFYLPIWITTDGVNYHLSKTIRQSLDLILTPKCGIELSDEKSDYYYYKALQASMIRMEFFMFILRNNGISDDEISPLIDELNFVSQDLDIYENYMIGFREHSYGSVRDIKIHLLFHPTLAYNEEVIGITNEDYPNYFKRYWDYEISEPTNVDFLNLVNQIGNDVHSYDLQFLNPNESIALILKSSLIFLSRSSKSGVAYRLANSLDPVQYLPYINRAHNVEPTYTVATDDDNAKVITKIVLTTLAVAAVVTLAYFGLKLRKATINKIISMELRREKAFYAASQLSPSSGLAPAYIRKIKKLDRAINKQKAFGRLLGIGASTLVPVSIFSAMSDSEDSSYEELMILKNRVG